MIESLLKLIEKFPCLANDAIQTIMVCFKVRRIFSSVHISSNISTQFLMLNTTNFLMSKISMVLDLLYYQVCLKE